MKKLSDEIMKMCISLFRKIKNSRFEINKLYIYIINLESTRYTGELYDVTRIYSLEELKKIVNERPPGFIERYSRWLDSGYICFSVMSGQSRIGIVWLAQTDLIPLEFGYKHLLKSDREAGLIDAYVLKDSRGKGAYRALWLSVLNEIQKMGIDKLYGYIRDDNEHSMVVHYKLGMKDVYRTVYCLRILWKYFYIEKSFKNCIDITMLKKNLRLN